MFHRSSSFTSSALSDLTNAIDSPDRLTPDTSFCESFSSECGTGKRPLDHSEKSKAKRCRLGVNNVDSFSQATEAGDKEDQEIEDIASESRIPTAKRPTVFGAMTAAAMGRRRPGGYGLPYLTTRPILQSFVSSNSNVYFCEVGLEGTTPFACAYTNAAKLGHKPLLAIGTEQGSVHIIDTARKLDDGAAREGIILGPHDNAIFDIKWSPSDTLLATSSGDHTVVITDPQTERSLYTLRGHASTIKCVMWDPNQDQILSTGGRDGAVMVWDLRVPTEGLRNAIDNSQICGAVLTIPDAHGQEKKPGRQRKTTARAITGLLYARNDPYGIITSGAYDGILRYWDLRRPTRKSRAIKPKAPAAIYATETDPTTFNGSLRARGIASLALGCGPTDGLVFALGADSCIHTYEVPTLQPLTSHIYTHERLQPTSFYVRVAASPCGRWLACGSTASGVCLFDVSGAARVKAQEFDTSGVTLGGHIGEVSALDWAHERLSSGADDGSVRTWRPNVEVARECLARPEPAIWDWSWADY